MDQTPLQQTVMDPTVEWTTSIPQEVGSVEWNTSISHDVAVDVNTELEKKEPTTLEPLSYDELFPALPSGGVIVPTTNVETAPANNNWGMRIASTVITQVFHVPYEERARIDGNSQFGETSREVSSICALIIKNTGAHIEVSSAKDHSLTFLITGKNEEVAKARKLILEKFQAPYRQSVHIPKEYHKFILGKKAKKLQEIENGTSTKVQVPLANDNSNEITVIGARENVETAIHQIRRISDEQSKQAYEKIDVPLIYQPFISICLEDRLKFPNVRVDIPPAFLNKTEIAIVGEKEHVLKCKELALQIYREMELKCTVVSVEVRKTQHRYVGGIRNTGITEILQQTGVSVEIPPPDDPSETITLRGPPEKLGPALTLVYAKANSATRQIIKAPAWLHKYIIGRSGANIRQITQELSKVHVEFTDNDGEIRLEGPVEEVEAARNKLQESINEMNSRLTCEEMIVDPQYYKYIIGKAGSNVNRIRRDTNIQIIIDEDGKNCIRLEGHHEGVAQAKHELTELISKMENEIEREIPIEQRFHRVIIGAKGDKIREIREKFNQVVIIIPDSTNNSDVVKIRGPKEDVDQCYKYLKNMVKELAEENYQIKVSIFRQFHKFIIGKSGVNIAKIREETKTRLDLPSENSNSDEIIITGKKENCLLAKEKIQKIQSELANIVEVEIIIPQKFHNAIIGAGGKLIRSISEECGGVAIKFPPTDSKSDKVCLRGPKDDVAKAKAKLVELSNEKHLSSYTAEVKAKSQIHRYIIGKNGSNIKKIREKTNARIIFPNVKDAKDSDIITIIGKKEAVEEARKELEQMVAELSLIKEDQVQIAPKYHKHFLAKRGELLRNLAEQYGDSLISFPRAGVDSDIVNLKGPKECVDAIKKRLLEIVADLEQVVSVVVVIPQKHHRTVMGPRGSKVQGIQSEFDVSIKFPDKDMPIDVLPNGDGGVRPNDMVIVNGKQENCDGAKEALLALVPITEELDIPFRYHRYIIGPKGDTVRSLMVEFEVNITVPPAQDTRNCITITGPPAQVKLAVEDINKKLENIYADERDRQLRNFQLKIRVNPEFHPKIIGRKGANITKIREKHAVNIQFRPRGDQDDDVITITGYESNCNAAKEAIMAIVGDLENMVKESIDIDARIFPRLIGQRGRAIRKIMDQFKVEIRFPRDNDNPNEVIIGGNPEKVEQCKDHLLNLAEEYLQDMDDVADAQSHYWNNRNENTIENAWLQNRTETPVQQSSAPSGGTPQHESTDRPKGFVVSGAPWTQSAPNVDSSEDFPSMGTVSTPSNAPLWGPRRS